VIAVLAVLAGSGEKVTGVDGVLPGLIILWVGRLTRGRQNGRKPLPCSVTSTPPQPTDAPIFLGWGTPLAWGVAREILKKNEERKTKNERRSPGNEKRRTKNEKVGAGNEERKTKNESGGVMDLGDQIVIVPSAFAMRLIQEELALQHPEGILLPRFETPSSFLNWEEAGKPVAGETEVLLAWIEVLGQINRADYPALFPNTEPGGFDFNEAKDFARTLSKLRDQLGGSATGHDFGAVAQLAANPEPARWSDLARLEVLYRQALTQRGFEDHNDLRTRLATGDGIPEGVSRIWLAALPDPQPLLLTALARMSQQIEMMVLVGADANEAEAFDGWGRPLASAWLERRTPWPEFDTHVHVVADPAEALNRLRLLIGNTKPAAGTLAVCACDREADSPRIAALIHSLGGEAVNPLGKAHTTHALHHALRAWAACLGATEPDFSVTREVCHIPVLVRNFLGGKKAESFSEINAWLDAADSALVRGQLSEIAARVAAFPETGDSQDQRRSQKIRGLAQPLRNLLNERQRQLEMSPLAALMHALTLLMDGVKIDTTTEEGTFTEDVLSAIETTARQAGDGMGHREFFELVLEVAGGERFNWSEGAEAVNLPGWVEAVWEQVPHLVIFGLNDHLVPHARHADPFLPAGLRNLVGLPSNDDTFAAAAFGLEQLRRHRTQAGRLDVIVPQADEMGDPLRPSRLLFLGPDDVLAPRVRRLFADAAPAEAQPYWEIPEAHRLDPRAEPKRVAKIIETVSASKLKDYLTDPAEFWLKRAVGMNAVEHGRIELDAAGFGDLTHGALERFGREHLGQKLTDAGAITRSLLGHLKEHLQSKFGIRPEPAIILQAMAAEARLVAFAEVQAQLGAKGWVIRGVEEELPSFEVAGVKIVGRLDRLDQNTETGAWRVFDYKTFAEAKTPRQTHLRMPRAGETEFLVEVPGKMKKEGARGASQVRRWKDLQLPVYHHALRSGHKEIGDKPLEIGYLCLPAQVDDVGPAFWEDFELVAEPSLQTIKDVVAKIRTGGPEVFAAGSRSPDYPLLPALAGRPAEGWMKIENLGGTRV